MFLYAVRKTQSRSISNLHVWARLFACVVSVIIASCSAPAGRKFTPQQIANLGTPATVLVETIYSADVTFPVFVPNIPGKLEIVTAVKKARKQGRIPDSNEAALDAYWQEVVGHLDRYLLRSPLAIKQNPAMVATGSGFIATPDGYVVTNAHVVADANDAIKMGFISQTLGGEIESQLRSLFVSARDDFGAEPSEQMQKLAQQMLLQLYFRNSSMGPVARQISVITGTKSGKFGRSGDPQFKGLVDAYQVPLPAAIVRMGAPIPGKDVAILKIDEKDLPTLPLASSENNLNKEDPVYILGFPGIVNQHPLLAQGSTTAEPDIKEGTYSAARMTKGGWRALEVSVPITHGNSGGPALNDAGEVIGLATFGSTAGQQEIQGFNFLVPVSLVHELLQDAKVMPVDSDLSKVYREGVVFFGANKYRSAIAKFRAVKEWNPNFPFIDKRIADSERFIAQGLDRSYVPYYWAAGIVVLLALLWLAYVVLSVKPKAVDSVSK